MPNDKPHNYDRERFVCVEPGCYATRGAGSDSMPCPVTVEALHAALRTIAATIPGVSTTLVPVPPATLPASGPIAREGAILLAIGRAEAWRTAAQALAATIDATRSPIRGLSNVGDPAAELLQSFVDRARHYGDQVDRTQTASNRWGKEPEVLEAARKLLIATEVTPGLVARFENDDRSCARCREPLVPNEGADLEPGDLCNFCAADSWGEARQLLARLLEERAKRDAEEETAPYVVVYAGEVDTMHEVGPRAEILAKYELILRDSPPYRSVALARVEQAQFSPGRPGRKR